jgi:hypothetical protein
MTPLLTIEDQKKEVGKYLHERFALDPSQYPDINEYLTNLVIGITAVKIWSEELDDMYQNTIPYLNEIVSNFNQVIIMGSIGFKIPSTILIRRSYENMIAFLYYKDHPVEFYLKESEMPRRFLKDDEIKGYLEKYPFEINNYTSFNSDKAKLLITYLLKHKAQEYESLSNYTHASNHRYLQMTEFLNDINPNNDDIRLLNQYVMEFNTIFNTTLILFLNNEYQNIEETKKKLLRNTIGGGNRRYKNQLREVFGSI